MTIYSHLRWRDIKKSYNQSFLALCTLCMVIYCTFTMHGDLLYFYFKPGEFLHFYSLHFVLQAPWVTALSFLGFHTSSLVSYFICIPCTLHFKPGELLHFVPCTLSFKPGELHYFQPFCTFIPCTPYLKPGNLLHFHSLHFALQIWWVPTNTVYYKHSVITSTLYYKH